MLARFARSGSQCYLLKNPRFANGPVEVGTNIEVEALLVSGRRGLLAEIRHWLRWYLRYRPAAATTAALSRPATICKPRRRSIVAKVTPVC